MSDSPLVAGIDAGTSRIRALVFEPTGNLVAQGSAPTPTTHPRAGWAEHDPESLWQAAVAAIRQAVEGIEEPRRIAGLGVASVGEAGVLIDRAGVPTAPVIAWFDARTEPQARWLAAHIGVESLFEVSGLRPDPLLSVCKLLWLRDHAPESMAHASKWLQVADYLAFRLGAAPATDYSLASRTGMLDLAPLTWSEDLIRRCGLDPELMSPLVASGTRIGAVDAQAARATGLPTGCAIAAGGHDHIVGAFAAGAWRTGCLLDSMGTAEALLLATRAPVFERRFVEQGYGQGALLVAGDTHAGERSSPGRGRYLVGGMMTSGACVEWFRDSFANGSEYSVLIDQARAVEPGSHGVHFFPHMRIGAPPHADSAAAGAYFGLRPEHDRGALFRALLEGLAYDARLVAEGLHEHAGADVPKPVLVIGGNVRNDLFLEIKASVFNRALTAVEMPESTSLGAAILGGIAAGVFDNADTALDGLRLPSREILPNPANARIYEAAFDNVYRHAPTVLGELHRRVHQSTIQRQMGQVP